MRSDDIVREVLALFDAPAVAFALLDSELRYRRVNPILAAINGKSVEEHLGRTVPDVIPEYAAALMPHLEQVRASGRAVRGVELPGERRAMYASFFPWPHDDGQHGVAVVCTEGTGLRLADALRFEELLASTSNELVDVPSAELDAEIERALARFGGALEADRVVVVEAEPSADEAHGALEWRDPSASPPPEPGWPLQFHRFPWLHDRIRAGEVALIRSPEDIPAGPQRDVIGAAGRAHVIAPLRTGAEVFGTLTVSWQSPRRPLTPFVAARARLMAGLIGNAMHRRQSEREIADRLAFEQLLSEISGALLAPSEDALAGAIERALGMLGEDRGVERTYLYCIDEDGVGTLAHEWCAPGVSKRAHRRGPIRTFAGFADRMQAGEAWVVDDTSELPRAFRAELKSLAAGGVRAQMIVPLMAGSRLIGAIGLDSLHSARPWSPTFLGRVQLVGQVFANAMERAQLEAEKREDRRLDQLLATVASSLIDAPADATDTAIDGALDRLREHLGLVRAMTVDIDAEHKTFELTHESGAPTSFARGVDRPLHEVGAASGAMLSSTLSGVHISDLPRDGKLRADWKRAGIAFAMMMVIRKDSSRRTVLGLLASAEGTIRNTLERRGAMIRELLSHALGRRDAELARAKAFEELARLKRRAEIERDYLREEVDLGHDVTSMVAASAKMGRVLETLDAVAPTTATVLVRGETGVGKELIARAIHARSPRADAPLVKVNCAAVPAELFESEFFGHVRGAFTGAHRDRTGRFEQADGGTLFLDEVGEIPVELQAKLLRVLQEGEIERVGDDRVRKVDVRVIAATNRDLEQDVEEGRFRRDLYYRLGVFPVAVPPLRERVADIVPIARALLARAARETSRPDLTLSDEDGRLLEAYRWPGNVRELAHVIERAVILSPTPPLRLDLALPSGASESPPPSPSTIRTDAELRAHERANLVAALERAEYKVAGRGGAAELLGVSPSTLRDRIRSFGIAMPKKRR